MARPGRLREKAILRGRERVDARRASRNRENYMSTPGRFKRDDIDTDQRRGFFGDLAQMGRDLSGPVKDSGFVKNVSQMGRDLIVDPLKKYSPGIFGGIQRGLGSLTNNLAQNEENERILGDLYTDELRKTMVPNWDVQKGDPGYEGSRREYHDKYKNLASLTDDADKKQYYLDQARSAYRNANVTRRVNYALGDLGFDTSAEAGQAAFEETPTEFKGRIDYGALPGNLQRGLEGTDAGEAFLRRHAVPKKGDTPEILQTIRNFNDDNRMVWSDQGVDYGGRSPSDELYSQYFKMDPGVKGSSPVSRQYKDMQMAGLIDSSPEALKIASLPGGFLEDNEDEYIPQELFEDIPQELFIDELQNYSGGVNPNDAGYENIFGTADNTVGAFYGRPGKSYEMNLQNYLSSGSPYDTGMHIEDELAGGPEIINSNALDNLDYSSNPYDDYSGFIRKNLPLGVTPWTNVDPSEFQQGGKYHMDTIFEGGAFDQLTPDQIEELKRGVSKSTGLW